MRTKFVLVCLAVFLLAASARAQYRTVIDKEVGSIFQQPNGFSWLVYGDFDGSPQTLDPAAIRSLMAHFDKFFPGEDHAIRGFPYSALRAYEAQEVAAGKPPIFITATYAGKKRPVLFSWSLGLRNGVPTTAASNWQYAVNVQDSRFIHFWINRYIQPMMESYQGMAPQFGPNLWFHLDECSFALQNFGVLDDNNNFVAGVTWDSPFPQNEAEYESGIETFFSQIKTLAPDIRSMASVGSLSDPSHFPNLYTNIPGAMHENIMSWYPRPSAYTRNQWYAQAFSYFSWMGSQGRVVNMRALIPANDPNALTTAFVVYSLLKGPNFFFAPGQGSYNIDPAQWAGMKALLGSPTAAMQSSQPSSFGSGYRLFWRNYQGGIVYLNWSGSTQTIPLSGAFYDPNGGKVTEIQVPDGVGTYVSYSNPTVKVLPPRIGPRYAFPAIGPITVTIEEDTPGTTIHYTLDGTTPTAASAVYTGSFQVSNSTMVQARAYYGSDPSWPSIASYQVHSSSMPTVQFTVTSDSGPTGSYYPSLSLDAIPLDEVSITYSVEVNGSRTTGTAKFLPGQMYSYFPITASGPTTVSITGTTGAVIGSNHTLQYTVQ